MRARTAVAALALAVLLTSASVVRAGATTRREHREASVVSQLSLRGSGGYELDLIDLGEEELLVAARPAGPRVSPFENVTYLIPASHSSTDLDQNLVEVRVGRLGFLRGRLKVTSTEKEENERGCTGRPALVERGVFVGSFHFRGEGGYTRVRASRARGSITRRSAQDCKVHRSRFDLGSQSGRHGHAAKRPAGDYKLIAGNRAGVFLEVEQRNEEEMGTELSFTDVTATVGGSLGDIKVGHSVSLPGLPAGESPLFTIPDLTDPLSEAILTPPAPFSGSATFRSDGLTAGSWSGDLAVRLPGLPPTPLTGNGIDAGLCAGQAGCTETLPPELQPTLEAPPGVIVTVAIKKKSASARLP